MSDEALPEEAELVLAGRSWLGVLLLLLYVPLEALVLSRPGVSSTSQLLGAAFFVLLSGAVLWRLVQSKTVVTRDGLVLKYQYAPTRRVAWHDIDHFKAGGNWGRSVFLVSAHGQQRFLPGISQRGLTVRWDGGQTRDIVALLQRRLDAAHRQTAIQA